MPRKKTASKNWFLESPIKWFVLSSRKTCEFFKQDQIQQFSTHYQLCGMASTSLLVNSFLGRTLADFYSWSHLHTLAENCFAPPSLHSHMCEVEHVNSPRKTAGSVIASNTFRQERKSPKAIWLSARARYTGDTAELVLGTLRKSPRRPLLRRPEVKAQKWRSANLKFLILNLGQMPCTSCTENPDFGVCTNHPATKTYRHWLILDHKREN